MSQTEHLVVLFHLGPYRFALASEEVIEICDGRRDREAALTCRYRGRDLPFLDLRQRFSLPPVQGWAPLIILKAPGPEGALGVQVDGVEAIALLRADAVVDLPEPLRPFLGAHLDGFWIQSLPVEEEGETKRVVRLLLRGEGLGGAPEAKPGSPAPGEPFAASCGGLP
ncbi:MAG: hypothetical protein A2Y95_01180 [Deltaproteobacteria bacterium RBG_13_65_10]|jgi:chemotaxis signal transduction protein|nr:MAG: hypothetical protein A2Y95_01180 [Deltaproteobacteria bacterium RBG_13_65_10]